MKNQIVPVKLKKPLFLLFLLLSLTKVFATTYTFTGAFDNNWTTSFNWPTGIPPNPIPAGDVVVITGACNINQAVTCNGSISYSGNFAVTISLSMSINAGGSFTIANLTNNGTLSISGFFITNNTFINNGVFNINGPINIANPIFNNGTLTINTAGSLTVYKTGSSLGSLLNGNGKTINVFGQLILNQTNLNNSGQVSIIPSGLITCFSGGSITNNSVISNWGTMIIGSTCLLTNSATVNNFNGGAIRGNGTFNNSWIYSGQSGSVIAPGNTITGRLTISGSSSANILGNTTYLCDINGTNSGVNCDLLAINNTATLTGATLNVNWGTFTPSAGQSFTILTCGSRTGQFASVNIPAVAGVAFAVVYNSNSVIIQATSVLPLHLLNFSGNIAQNGLVNLFWQTDNEINVAGYEIQAADNGISFSKKGFVDSKNYSSIQNYNYTLPQQNYRVYYRLKMIDIDGQFTYSKVIALSINGYKSLITLYPNPAAHTIYLESNGALKNLSVTISDISGKLILSQQYGVSSKREIDVSKLPAGIYTVKVFNDKEIINTERFLKQ